MDIPKKNLLKLSKKNLILKRSFDLIISLLLILLIGWLIFFIWLVVSIKFKSNGFFVQKRVGRYGVLFSFIKFKTMSNLYNISSSVSALNQKNITTFGMFLRKYKIDELPQLYNVLVGDMSFVGPRPDVPGFADKLTGIDKSILSLRPGITGPASIKYKNEETLLKNLDDPENYNRKVIWPDKVKINLNYIRNWSFFGDLKYIRQTIFKIL